MPALKDDVSQRLPVVGSALCRERAQHCRVVGVVCRAFAPPVRASRVGLRAPPPPAFAFCRVCIRMCVPLRVARVRRRTRVPVRYVAVERDCRPLSRNVCRTLLCAPVGPDAGRDIPRDRQWCGTGDRKGRGPAHRNCGDLLLVFGVDDLQPRACGGGVHLGPLRGADGRQPDRDLATLQRLDAPDARRLVRGRDSLRGLHVPRRCAHVLVTLDRG